MTKTSLHLRQLAGALNEFAEEHSAEAANFRALELPELAQGATARALTFRSVVTELVMRAEREEMR
ncbi:MAG: hypothetical protein KY445_00965 [Armatimonadetes bacterium]|nr:hypothetical protein [Armatimonadota bacterium]